MGVSIIIPCFNHASTLERAVVSALKQSGVTEVLIVDDCSSDQSASVADTLAVRDGRVHTRILEVNSGPGVARNRGVTQAVGDFICFLDADDELMADFIGSALKLFQQNPDLIVAKCEMEFFDPVKGYILPMHDPRHQSAILSSSCGMVMRREHFLLMGGFPEDPVFRGPAGGEDVAFMQAVMAHFQPIARIEQPGYHVWSCDGSHIDRFLASTRMAGAGFEFVNNDPIHSDAGFLDSAMESYLTNVARNLNLAADKRTFR
jgi:glycosyltransferase involved in cell wall biosynthesis